MAAISATVAGADLELFTTSYLRHLATANLSPRTRESYHEAITQLDVYLASQGMPRTVRALRREHIEGFIGELLALHSTATARNRFAGLRAFFNWLVAEDEITLSPMARMRPPKLDAKLVPVIPEADLRRLLAALAKDHSFSGRRDAAVVRTFLSTGARLSEIANLRYAPDDPTAHDVDLDARVARVMGKGRRERLVPLSASAVKALDRYERVRREHRYSSLPWYWIGARGRLNANGMANQIKKRAAAVGISLHIHQLRHTWTHQSLAAGLGELNVQRLGGWKDGTMLRRYGAAMADQRALEAAKAASWDDKL
jgi:integrase/recombinase XerC